MSPTPATPATDLEAALAALAEPAPPALVGGVLDALRLGDECMIVEGPIGPVWVAFNRRGISFLHDPEHGPAAFATRYPHRPLRRAASPPPEVGAALAGPPGHRERKATTRLRYDLSACTPFQQAVLGKTAEIPRGEVRSYGWVAREIGHEGAVRAVGTALGRNPVPILIPCHRVVRSDGRIGNYALGSEVKHRLLVTEGVDLDELEHLAATGARFVGSDTTHVFCLPTCHAARRIQPRHRVTFRSAVEARASNYRPCLRCRPISTS